MRLDRAPLAIRLILIGKHLGLLLERRLAGRNLNRTQAMILILLTQNPGQMPLQLCAPAGVEPANVTRTLQALERMGFLERRPHPTDRRASLFYPTDQGRDTAHLLAREMESISAELLEGLEPESLSQLEGIMLILGHNIHARLSEAGCGHPPLPAGPRRHPHGGESPDDPRTEIEG